MRNWKLQHGERCPVPFSGLTIDGFGAGLSQKLCHYGRDARTWTDRTGSCSTNTGVGGVCSRQPVGKLEISEGQM